MVSISTSAQGSRSFLLRILVYMELSCQCQAMWSCQVTWPLWAKCVYLNSLMGLGKDWESGCNVVKCLPYCPAYCRHLMHCCYDYDFNVRKKKKRKTHTLSCWWFGLGIIQLVILGTGSVPRSDGFSHPSLPDPVFSIIINCLQISPGRATWLAESSPPNTVVWSQVDGVPILTLPLLFLYIGSYTPVSLCAWS